MTTQHEVELPRAPANLTARPTSAFSILVTWDSPESSVSGSGKNRITKYKLYHRRVSRAELCVIHFNVAPTLVFSDSITIIAPPRRLISPQPLLIKIN